MVVIVLEAAPIPLRGELTKWMLETKPGVFVGNINALVRTKLWKKIYDYDNSINALMIFNAKNEQGFDMLMNGEPRRGVIDIEGINLIKVKE